MLDNKLIESTLQLTGKNMYDVSFDEMQSDGMFKTELSIEKFCYYLLSPEFIEKYAWYHIDKPASEFHSKKYEYEVCIEI